jgi:hypothetical protein
VTTETTQVVKPKVPAFMVRMEGSAATGGLYTLISFPFKDGAEAYATYFALAKLINEHPEAFG